MDGDSSMSASFYNNGFAAFSSAAQYQQNNSFLFGLIAPGTSVRTDFTPVEGSNGTKYTLSVTSTQGDFPSPLTSVHQLVFFLLPNAAGALPPNSGLLVYWQVEISSANNAMAAPVQPQQSGFELLGSLVPSVKQSEVFRTGWSEREEFIGIDRQQRTPVVRVNFGVSIEPLEVVRNLTNVGNNIVGNSNPMGTLPGSSPSPADKRPLVAQKIAMDLYNFMLSFDTGGATGNQTMTVPANIFDRWWKRFEAKLKRDPNFFLKNE